MVKVKEDLTGRVFGRLTVLSRAEDYIRPSGQRSAQWLCECSCDNKTRKIIVGTSLTSKKSPTRSCGCIQKEKAAKAQIKSNTYDLSGEYGIGFTSNTNNEFYFDLCRYDEIKDYCWCERKQKDGYVSLFAWSKDRHRMIKMTDLLGYKDYDHINRNPLDNRDCNLRAVSKTENRRNHSKYNTNTSGFTGVSWNKNRQRWRSYIIVDYKQIDLGLYNDLNDAVVARLEAELKYFGRDFAPQRHLFDEYGITTQNDYGVKE